MFTRACPALLAAGLLLGGISGEALAGPYHHHYHSGVSLYVGPVWGAGWGPGWYGPPYPYPTYYAAPVVVAPEPKVYVEQAPAPAAPQPNYWYFCQASQAYYPYVQECPGGWVAVPPQPQR